MKEIATDPELAADDAERKHEEILNERKVIFFAVHDNFAVRTGTRQFINILQFQILELVRGFDFCVQMMYAFKIDHKYYLVLGKRVQSVPFCADHS